MELFDQYVKILVIANVKFSEKLKLAVKNAIKLSKYIEDQLLKK